MKKIIETTTGIYQGFEEHNHVNFLGVPFGYTRRFKRAEEYYVDDPQKINLAVRPGIQPMQDNAFQNSNIRFGENCLNLDISTPDVDGSFPIVIEFYGGGFLHGGNAIKNMPWLDEQSVVHIMPNYRLGLFGWGKITGGDTNVGLSDQLKSIEWVIDNAAKFGGDVNNISLVGLSAGAKSIAALMASNSELLDRISKIILFSGSFQTIRNLETARKVTERFCKTNNISTDNDLLNLTDDGLLTVQQNTIGDHIATNWFGPVVDNDLISDNWLSVLAQRVQRTDFKSLIGAGSNEQAPLSQFNLSRLKNNVVPDLFGKNADVLLKQLTPQGDQKTDLVRLISEAMYSYPAFRSQKFLVENNAEVYGNYFTVLDGRHGGNIDYLNTPTNELNIEYRKNRKYYFQLIMDFLMNDKPYNDEIKYEWPLFDENQLVMELDSNDLSSVSMINHQWIENMPWQNYKL
ncbi:carboxylesterase family protein [Companilactobacillus jidongensis]|uniref:carboxylesterase family protein n=1 Tax=Companilactobacillus jidongensis TaxID=2486006 RepID=UPI000F788757|nr:carboxylesterase family protein [Companilactobacillus jidongensis]